MESHGQAVSVKGRVGLALDFDLTKTPAHLGSGSTRAATGHRTVVVGAVVGDLWVIYG